MPLRPSVTRMVVRRRQSPDWTALNPRHPAHPIPPGTLEAGGFPLNEVFGLVSMNGSLLQVHHHVSALHLQAMERLETPFHMV